MNWSLSAMHRHQCYQRMLSSQVCYEIFSVCRLQEQQLIPLKSTPPNDWKNIAVNSWLQRFIQSPQLQSWNLQNVSKNLIFLITHILYGKKLLVHFFQNNKASNLLLEPSNWASKELECNLSTLRISVSICTPFLLGKQKMDVSFIFNRNKASPTHMY